MKKEGIGLLLIGHGASLGGGGAVRRLAERLGQDEAFDQVAACFWKETPYVGEGLKLITSPIVLAIPVFATEGRIARDLIPAEMGLQGPLTLLSDGRSVHYLRPIGVHPALARLVEERAQQAAKAAGFEVSPTTLLLIAHGNRQGGGAKASAEGLAAQLLKAGRWAEVRVCFLEEEPRAANWQFGIKTRQVVVLPMLLAEGQHAASDLPPLFGLKELGEADPVLTEFGGYRLAITQGLVDDLALENLIRRMVQETLSRPSQR
jgi:sirohydrochlorin cobaltochelatase